MPQYLTKSLGALSTGIGIISTASPPGITLASSLIDVQRRLTFSTTTAGDFSGVGITITGKQDAGNTIVETVWGTTTSTTAWTTIQDFDSISSVVCSCSVLSIPVNIQTNAVGGTAWIPVNTAVAPTNIGFGLTFNTTRVPMAGVLEYSLDNPPGQGPQNTTSSWSHPYPITSTSISTVANTNSAGTCLIPISCWRLSLTSTSTAGTTTTSSLKAFLTAIQTGLGSAL